MKTRLTIAMLAGLGLLTVACLAEEKEQGPRLTYELTIDDQTFEIRDATPTEITVQGKRATASIRIKPIQHYAIEALEFDYDKMFSLKDDFDEKERTITLIRGSGVSIVVTDFGPAGTHSSRDTLAEIAEEMEKRIKRGTCTDFRKSLPMPISFKRSRGYTAAFTYKDEDDDEQVCRMYALDGKGRRFSVIVQYDMTERELSESLARITLDSITGR